MNSKLLWSPSSDDTNIKKFIEKNSFFLKDHSYKSLHDWSIKQKEDFWSSVWDFTKIKGIKKKPIIEDEIDFLSSKFFNKSKLNFTENLIKSNKQDDAIVFYSEQKLLTEQLLQPLRLELLY